MLDQGQSPTSRYSQEVEIHSFLNSIDMGEQTTLSLWKEPLDRGQSPTSHYSHEVEMHAFLNSIDMGEQPPFPCGRSPWSIFDRL
jgi:hypothetical protein